MGLGEEAPVSARAKGPVAPPPAPSEWIEDERPARRGVEPVAEVRATHALPADVAASIRNAVAGTVAQKERTVRMMTKASEAYDRHRYEEAVRHVRPVSELAPTVPEVREIAGLAAYRAQQWNLAKANLLAHHDLSGDPQHLPLVMDCDRAHRRYRAVEKTFEMLEDEGADADTLAEGRIVMAGAWADRREYDKAVEVLTRAGALKSLRNPGYRHIRLWYALADVYDRAGDAAAAREMFARVVAAEPDAYDAAARLADLGVVARRKNRPQRTRPVSKKREA